MKLFIFISSILLFTIASCALPPLGPDEAKSAAQRHIIRHDHKLNCLNCFCGYNAIERARHACPPDRDLVRCPPSVPIRKCYRCSCFSRIPVTPSPPVMRPHPHGHEDDDFHKQDDGHKVHHGRKQDEDRKNQEKDHMEVKDHKEDDDGNPKIEPKPAKGPKYDDAHEDEEGMLMSTPDANEGDMRKPASQSQKPEPAAMLSKKPMSHPTLCHEPTPTPSPSPSSGLCSTFSRRGGTGNTIFDVDLVLKHGTFKVSWQMDRVPDMLEIFYEGEKIFTTVVPVKSGGTANIKYSGNSSIITVRVSSRTNGTGWFMQIGCPTSD